MMPLMYHFSMLVMTLCLMLSVTAAKEIDVSVSVDNGNQVLLGSPVTLKCEYEGKDLNSADHVITVGWSIGEEGNTTSIAFFSYGNPTPITYPTNSYQPPAYVMTMDYGAQLGSSEFTVQSVDMNDNRSFRCSVNALLDVKEGTGIAAVVVNVLSSSVIISSSVEHTNNSDVTVISGITETFTCTAIGSNPSSTLSWTLNDLPQPGWPSDDKDTSTISLSPQWTNHLTVLRCRASVPADDVGVHTNVILDVKVPPTDNSVELIDAARPGGHTNGSLVRVDDGMQHAFTCEVSNTRPAAHIEWYLGPDKVIDGITTPTPPIEGDELVDYSSTLLLMVDVNQHRKYLKCDASIDVNRAPNPVQKYVVLNVFGTPLNLTLSGNTDLTENVQEKFTCEARNGYPRGMIEWYNNDINITQIPANNTENENNRYDVISVLEFVPKRSDNQRTITCQVFHEVNDQMKSLLINVKYCSSSIVFKEACPYTVSAGNTATLTCTSAGSIPNSAIEWYERDTPVQSSHEPSYEDDDYSGKITKLQYTTSTLNENNGFYLKCCVTNPSLPSCTSICNTCQLQVDVLPELPRNVDILQDLSTTDSLTVQWTRGHNGGVTQWFVVQYRQGGLSDKINSGNITEVVGQSVYNHTLKGLLAGEAYFVTVSSGNIYGQTNGVEILEPGITIPNSPEERDITMTYNKETGTLHVSGLHQNGDGTSCLKIQTTKNAGTTWEDWKCLYEDVDSLKIPDHEQVDILRGMCCVGEICGEPAVTETDAMTSVCTCTTVIAIGASVSVLLVLALFSSLAIIAVLCRREASNKEMLKKKGHREVSQNAAYQDLDPSIRDGYHPYEQQIHGGHDIKHDSDTSYEMSEIQTSGKVVKAGSQDTQINKERAYQEVDMITSGTSFQ